MRIEENIRTLLSVVSQDDRGNRPPDSDNLDINV